MNRLVAAATLAALVGPAAASLAACSPGAGGPRDVASSRSRAPAAADAGLPPETRVPPPPEPQPFSPTKEQSKLRLLVRANCRALAVDDARLYYGDAEADALYGIAKAGGEPVRIARRAPVPGALAVDGPMLAWVATPGDVVLRVASGGGTPKTARDRGIFSDVAMQDGDLFVAEVDASGGAVARVTGATAARIATLDAAPRALVVDSAYVYVVTATKVLRAPHERGELETLATGQDLTSPALDGDAVYVVSVAADGLRQILRVGKTGGATVLARDVRDAPIAVEGGEVFYVDAQRPALVARRLDTGASRVLALDDALARTAAMTADANSVYVATGEREDGAIWAAARAHRAPSAQGVGQPGS